MSEHTGDATPKEPGCRGRGGIGPNAVLIVATLCFGGLSPR